MTRKNSYCFLTYGKTQSSDKSSTSFPRYVGFANSKILAINPSKKELESIYGREIQNNPEYTGSDDSGKFARVTFIVATVPEDNNGIETINRSVFTLHNTPAYNADKTMVQVLDAYGNSARIGTEIAKNKGVLPSNFKIDRTNYRIAARGEADLTAFIKTFLGISNILEYKEGAWSVGANAADGLFQLENLKDYFNGDFSEIRQAIAVQPNNKVKLLYGVRSADNKLYQEVCTNKDLILPHWISQGTKTWAKAAEQLLNCKARGMYANIDYRICTLQEWSPEPTNLETAPQEETEDDVPW